MLIPYFDIVEYSDGFREKVKSIVMKISEFYPSIDEWFDKNLIPKLNSGNSICYMVLDNKKNVVGVAISGFDGNSTRIAKLKTFYLEPEFRHSSISVPLLKKTLNYWMQKRVKRIFVTFAEEELDILKGFFDKFGFLMEGMMPQQYRLNKNEYVMGKTFVYDSIDKMNFTDFIRLNLLNLHGIRPKETGNEFIAEEESSLSKKPRNIFVKIIDSPTPKAPELYKYMEQKISETKSVYGILVSYYPIPEEPSSERIKVIDGYLIENMFFPLELKREGYAAVILPIREDYAKDLLNLEVDQESLGKKRVSITHERAYFTGKDNFDGIQRGCTFLFHVVGKGVSAEAKIKSFSMDTVSNTLKNYRERGVLLTEDLMRKHAMNGRVTTFLLTNVKLYPEEVKAADVRAITRNPDFQGQRITQEELDQIRKLARNDPFLY